MSQFAIAAASAMLQCRPGTARELTTASTNGCTAAASRGQRGAMRASGLTCRRGGRVEVPAGLPGEQPDEDQQASVITVDTWVARGCARQASPSRTAAVGERTRRVEQRQRRDRQSPERTITVAAVRRLAPPVRNCLNAYAAEIAEPAGRLIAMAERL